MFYVINFKSFFLVYFFTFLSANCLNANANWVIYYTLWGKRAWYLSDSANSQGYDNCKNSNQQMTFPMLSSNELAFLCLHRLALHNEISISPSLFAKLKVLNAWNLSQGLKSKCSLQKVSQFQLHSCNWWLSFATASETLLIREAPHFGFPKEKTGAFQTFSNINGYRFPRGITFHIQH